MDHKITEIFYLIDEFCKEFDKVKEGHVLSEEVSKKRRNRMEIRKTPRFGHMFSEFTACLVFRIYCSGFTQRTRYTF